MSRDASMYAGFVVPFEVVPHTADAGLVVSATSLDELFSEAARGLFSLIVSNPDSIRPRESLDLALRAEDLDGLFMDWLRELLYLFSAHGFLLAASEVRIEGETALSATCRGEPADWTRHEPGHEVKAITYHALAVEKGEHGYEARFIVDI